MARRGATTRHNSGLTPLSGDPPQRLDPLTGPATPGAWQLCHNRTDGSRRVLPQPSTPQNPEYWAGRCDEACGSGSRTARLTPPWRTQGRPDTSPRAPSLAIGRLGETWRGLPIVAGGGSRLIDSNMVRTALACLTQGHQMCITYGRPHRRTQRTGPVRATVARRLGTGSTACPTVAPHKQRPDSE